MNSDNLPHSKTCYLCNRPRYTTFLYRDGWVDMCQYHFQKFDKIQDRQRRDFQ